MSQDPTEGDPTTAGDSRPRGGKVDDPNDRIARASPAQESPTPSGVATALESSHNAVRRAGRTVFGDNLGLALFAGALIFYGFYWRLGFFINDSELFANALVNVADGRLALLETPYSLTTRSQPGTAFFEGRPYARNYGQIMLALPVLWLLKLFAWLTELRITIAAVWSLLVILFARQLALVFDRAWLRGAGAVVSLLVFLMTTAVASDLPTVHGHAQLELFALQLSTMLAGALAVVLCYRLVELFHGRQIGGVTAAALVLATPMSFWASIPKRHVLTAMVVLLTVYCFAISREQGRRTTASRALAYGAIGFLASVHSFEAVFLLLVFGPVDTLTAPSYSVRSWLLLGGAFLLSLIPLFVVNTLMSGNPLRTPRLLATVPKDFSSSDVPDAGTADGFGTTDGGGQTEGGTGGQTGGDETGGQTTDGGTGGQTDDSTGGGATGDDSAGGQTDDGGTGDSSSADNTGDSTGDGGTDTDGQAAADDGTESVGDSSADDADGGFSPRSLVPAPVVRGLGFSIEILGFIYRSVVNGLVAVREFDRVYHTFVRGGWMPDIARQNLAEYEAIELSLLEASPLLAALLWLPIATVRRFQATVPSHVLPATTAGQTDLLAAGYGLVFSLVYLPRLPFHSQITVRYILPIVPLLLYGVARLAVVRRAVRTRLRVLAGSYVTAVVLGGVALVTVLKAVDPAIGEVMQLHALVGLATAGVGAGAVLTSPFHDDSRVVAAGLAVPAAATTLFILFSGLLYFQYGPFALDIVGETVNALP